jgi:hypothetical protein
MWAVVLAFGSEVEGARQIAAAYLPHQHELMHAHMELYPSRRQVIPALRAFIDVMKSEGWRRSVGGAMLEERLTERDDGQTAARFVAKALADTGLG